MLVIRSFLTRPDILLPLSNISRGVSSTNCYFDFEVKAVLVDAYECLWEGDLVREIPSEEGWK